VRDRRARQDIAILKEPSSMNKSPFGARLGAWLCALLLTVAPVEAADYFDTFPGGTRIPAAVLMTGCVANGGCLGPVSASNPLPVPATLLRRLAGSRRAPPARECRKVKRDCDFALYAERNLVERFFQFIKQFRGRATRYEKTARNFLAGLQLVCALAWLK
jgi:hypothetical protein